MDAVERELKIEEDKLVSQMEYARYEHETEMLRERKLNLKRLKHFRFSSFLLPSF